MYEGVAPAMLCTTSKLGSSSRSTMILWSVSPSSISSMDPNTCRGGGIGVEGEGSGTGDEKGRRDDTIGRRRRVRESMRGE